MKQITFTAAKAAAREVGFTLRKSIPGESEIVVYPLGAGIDSPSAYFTDCPVDALDTARAMAADMAGGRVSLKSDATAAGMAAAEAQRRAEVLQAAAAEEVKESDAWGATAAAEAAEERAAEAEGRGLWAEAAAQYAFAGALHRKAQGRFNGHFKRARCEERAKAAEEHGVKRCLVLAIAKREEAAGGHAFKVAEAAKRDGATEEAAQRFEEAAPHYHAAAMIWQSVAPAARSYVDQCKSRAAWAAQQSEALRAEAAAPAGSIGAMRNPDAPKSAPRAAKRAPAPDTRDNADSRPCGRPTGQGGVFPLWAALPDCKRRPAAELLRDIEDSAAAAILFA